MISVLPVSVSGFPPSFQLVEGQLNRSFELGVGRAEFLWAAATIGTAWQKFAYPHWIFRGSNVPSDWVVEMSGSGLHERLAMIHSTIGFSRDGLLMTPFHKDQRVATEKGIANYTLGMTTAKLLANRLLGFPFLVHVERVLQAVDSPLQGGHADLLALTQSGKPAAVWEAKGRQRRDAKALRDGKNQASDTQKQMKGSPVLAVVSMTYFQRSQLKATIEDPPPRPLELTPEQIDLMLVSYYFETWYSLRSSITRGLPRQLWISMHPTIFSLLSEFVATTLATRDKETLDEAVRSCASGLRAVLPSLNSEQWTQVPGETEAYWGRDGIAVGAPVETE